MNDSTACYGHVTGKIINKNGTESIIDFKNAVLVGGRAELVKVLANKIGSSYEQFVSRMIFGDGGTDGTTIRYVDADRTGLFGITRATKPVIASIDSTNTTQVVFTSVLGFADANGYNLSEMALVLNNDILYSMATFAPLSKTSDIQIIWNWRVNLL
jgi:hypothetical protein